MFSLPPTLHIFFSGPFRGGTEVFAPVNVFALIAFEFTFTPPEYCTDGLTYLTPGETRREVQKVLKEYKASIAQLARCAGVPAQNANKFMHAGGDFGGDDTQSLRAGGP